ncbi:adenine phosphoribosyltransferase [Clostridia bacterium]|nr:adenine phosphoribosyltransferase [Clostridia bacterium]
MEELKQYVRNVDNFPKEGILFRDITTILQDAQGLRLAVDEMRKSISGLDYDLILGPESRGFIFGVPLAYLEYKPFIPVRKKGKLPAKTVSVEYDLEYGKGVLEIHADTIKKGDKVVIIDDLLATGGTLEAIVRLVEGLGGEVVKISCLIELIGLKGREKLKNYAVDSIIVYEGE